MYLTECKCVCVCRTTGHTTHCTFQRARVKKITEYEIGSIINGIIALNYFKFKSEIQFLSNARYSINWK